MEEFDDLNMYRRKVEKLEQQVGDLGEAIGVLKKEKADLYLSLMDLVSSPQSNLVRQEAEAALNRIKIS